VPGRIGADGQEAAPLDLPALRAGLTPCPTPTHFAVCLLHATRNPAHEQQVRAALQAAWPGVPVTCSHELPARASTPANLNAPWQRCGNRAGVAHGASAGSAATTGLAGQLVALANAMQACLVAQAVSSVVREAMDCAAAVFLPDGRMLAQARSLPLLLGSLSPAVAGLLEVPRSHHAAWRRLPQQRPLGRWHPPARLCAAAARCM
jgi:N-methylhydantoinase B